MEREGWDLSRLAALALHSMLVGRPRDACRPASRCLSAGLARETVAQLRLAGGGTTDPAEPNPHAEIVAVASPRGGSLSGV
jgi:hypothetical protein